MKTNNDVLWSSQAIAVGTVTTEAVPINQIVGYAVHLIWTGTPTGTFTIEVSCDPNKTTGGVVPTATDWVTLSGSGQLSGGASGSFIYNVSEAFYNWVRVKYVGSSGSGSVTCRINQKGV